MIVSPHYDDGVFSCGELIRDHPGTGLVTVFGAAPNEGLSTDWDRDAGFADARDAVAARRDEDGAAAARLSAHVMWLGFSDSQYGPKPSAAGIASAMSDLISAIAATTVVFPLGLFHADHRLAHDALLRLVPSRDGSIDWFLYGDAIYRRHEAVVAQRLRRLRSARFLVEPIQWPSVCSESKRAAVYCYRSQLVALSRRGRSGFLDVFRVEHYWRLRPEAS